MDLSKLPVRDYRNLDKNLIEMERQTKWNILFEKYERKGAQCTHSVSIDKIDDYKEVVKRSREMRQEEVVIPVSKTVKKYLAENAEMVDELITIATIADASDEESIGSNDSEYETDDSEEENQEGNEEEAEYNTVKVATKPLYFDDDTTATESEVDAEYAQSTPLRRIFQSSPAMSPFKNSFRELYLNKSRKGPEVGNGSPVLDGGAGKRSPVLETGSEERSPVSEARLEQSSLKSDNLDEERQEDSILVCTTCGRDTSIPAAIGLNPNSFRCDNCCLSESHLSCEDPSCSVCPAEASFIEARKFIIKERMDV